MSWLAEHWSQSVHIVNRLLRYPVEHSRVVEWAEQRYRNGDLADRRSEVIAILLPGSGLQRFPKEKPETLGWAIMQCTAPRAMKIRWIREVQDTMPVNAIIEYAVRLNAPVIVRGALKELRSHGTR